MWSLCKVSLVHSPWVAKNERPPDSRVYLPPLCSHRPLPKGLRRATAPQASTGATSNPLLRIL